MCEDHPDGVENDRKKVGSEEQGRRRETTGKKTVSDESRGSAEKMEPYPERRDTGSSIHLPPRWKYLKHPLRRAR